MEYLLLDTLLVLMPNLVARDELNCLGSFGRKFHKTYTHKPPYPHGLGCMFCEIACQRNPNRLAYCLASNVGS